MDLVFPSPAIILQEAINEIVRSETLSNPSACRPAEAHNNLYLQTLDDGLMQGPASIQQGPLVVLQIDLVSRSRENHIACGDQLRNQCKPVEHVENSGLHSPASRRGPLPTFIGICRPGMRSIPELADVLGNIIGTLSDSIASRIQAEEIERAPTLEGFPPGIENRTRPPKQFWRQPIQCAVNVSVQCGPVRPSVERPQSSLARAMM